MNRPTWHEYFLLLAKLVSARSTCNSRKIGAVIVRKNRILATGYNGAVHGAPHCTDRGPDFCLRRSIGASDADKYNYCISSHAEVNAIDQAARFGISLEGASLYCTLEPCNWCFKQLIQAGIQEVYYEEPYESLNKDFDQYWRRIMESESAFRVFKRMQVSEESLQFVLEILQQRSWRKLMPTPADEQTTLRTEALAQILSSSSKETQE